jgi:hypothetical protein
MTTNPIPGMPARFKVGDLVWSFNGQARIVTRVRWCRAMKRSRRDPTLWGWCLNTVHPDDPKCTGTGFEYTYRDRIPGESSPGLMREDVVPATRPEA